MTGPVNMNQVLIQTPSVEKVQQAEQYNPENTQRHDSLQEQAQTRQRSETVQQSVQPENKHLVEDDEKEREESGRRKRKGASSEEADELEAREAKGEDLEKQGRIVDVIV
ncbi:MAG: hypothetical protein KKB20_09025 [Proteobacteria bacterium]|nr:hypothetical protein [Pseudomonadota bacterium]